MYSTVGWSTRLSEHRFFFFFFTTPPKPALRSAQTHLEGVPRFVWGGMMLAVPEHPCAYVVVV